MPDKIYITPAQYWLGWECNSQKCGDFDSAMAKGSQLSLAYDGRVTFTMVFQMGDVEIVSHGYFLNGEFFA